MVEPHPATLQPESQSFTPDSLPPKRRRRAAAAVGISLVILALWVALGRKKASENSPLRPVVAVAKVTRQELTQRLTLTAEFHPYQQVMVHAKVSGYVRWIGVDIGDHLKAGQVLAILEIPEAADDLKRSTAAVGGSQDDVKRAEADYGNTHVQYQRLAEAARQHPKLVAQQDLDSAKAKDDAMQSALAAASRHVEESQAEEEKMRTLLAYTSITAPFDGVVTRRFADTGALVQAGISSETQAMPLIELAEDDLLRLVISVPESAVPLIHIGLPVEVSVDALHKTFTGAVTRYAGKVDRSTRTMETEVDIPNPERIYTPGMYVSVSLLLQQKKGVLAVPLQALSLENGEVMVLTPQDRLEIRKIKVGLETPSQAEIVSGLLENELVVVGSRTGLEVGQNATGRLVPLPAAP